MAEEAQEPGPFVTDTEPMLSECVAILTLEQKAKLAATTELPKLLDWLAWDHTSDEIRDAIVRNPATGDDTLELLVKQGDGLIKRKATNELRRRRGEAPLPEVRKVQLEPTPLGVVSSAPTWKSARDRIIEAADSFQAVVDERKAETKHQDDAFGEEGVRELAKMIGCERGELGGIVAESDAVTQTCTIDVPSPTNGLRLKGKRQLGEWMWFLSGHEANEDAIYSIGDLTRAVVNYRLKLWGKQYGE